MRHVLAPTGKLRVGVYTGSPQSLMVDTQSGEPYGMGYDLGRELARSLDLPFEPVIFQKNGDVLEAARNNQIDLALVNATPVRAEYLAFAQAILFSEQSYLVGPGCPAQSIAEIDAQGLIVGVSGGSTSETILPTLLKKAKVIAINSLEDVKQQLILAGIDAFGTNKGILYALSHQIPGSRVLNGAWGFERIALGVPKSRKEAIPLIQSFSSAIQENGFLHATAQRAGVQGVSLKET